MNKNLLGAVFTASAFLPVGSPVFAEGDDLLRGRASVGFSSYALTITGAGSTTPDATSQYLAVGAGLTYATGNMYFDASGSISVDATHDWPGNEGDFQRTDTALTGGYLLDDGWSVFGGYKWGTSEFSKDTDPSYKLTFEAYGFFGGASRAIGLGNGASMSLSGALAYMKGDLYNNSTLNDSGNALGLSFTAAYNLPLGADSGIQVRGFYQNYSFSGFSNSNNNADEEILGIEAGYHLDF